jgi:hypothetical protein
MDLIPKGDIAQNLFRSSFHNWRLNSLSKKPAHPGSTAVDDVARATAGVRAHFREFVPEFDPRLLES